MTMYAPLRQSDLFETLADSQISSSEALPARTSAAPTPRGRGSKEKGQASSLKPSASLESAALVGSLLKTALISELGALTPLSLHWRESATPAGRSWSVLATSAPIMSDPEAGLSDATLRKLPTPMASDGMKDGAGGGAGSTYPFRKILATPRKTDADRGFRGDVLSQLHGHNSRHAGMMPTPVKPNGGRTLTREAIETGKRANGSKAQVDTPNLLRHAIQMLPTPVTQSQQGGMRWEGGAGGRKVLEQSGLMDVMRGNNIPTKPSDDRPVTNTEMSCADSSSTKMTRETLPTPTKRDKRMDAWSPAYDKRKSPTMDAVMDGALTDRASDKWQYARMIAAVLTDHGLSGASMTLPVVYGWMMGYPAHWLERALLSAVREGLLPLPSSSKRTATRSSPKSRKPSGEQS